MRLEDLDLAGEIREAVVGNDPHGVQFMSRYRALGLGAFDLLPGQRAWLDWASTDGDLTQLSAEALGRIAAADAEAHRLGLVAPFGPAWDLRLHDELRAQPRAVLHRWIKEAGDLRWETERAIFKDPQSFPGVVDSPNPLYSPTAQLEYVMRRLPRDPELSRRWDVRMARERWMWRRVASLGSRAYAWIPVGEREKTYQRHVDLVGGFHLALFRAASGAALRRIMGFRPRTPEGKKIESLAARTLQYMAEVSDVVPAADDPGWVEGPEDG